ncbi:MAG: DUF2955 domain-containing protein, partial [Burkholderiales bacterium]
MQAEASAHLTGIAGQRRIGLRVALAVSAGLTYGIGSGAVIPFVGPLFAAQFLLGSAKPLPVAKAMGSVGLILLAGQFFIVVTALFGGRPVQMLTLLGLFYFLCFVLQARGNGGPAIFLVLVTAVMVPLLDLLHGDLDQSMIMILFQGSAGGVVLSWLAHAVLPEPAGTEATPPPPAVPVADPITRAFASTAILLGAVAAISLLVGGIGVMNIMLVSVTER